MDNVCRYICCLICLIWVAACICINAKAIEPEPTAKACILMDADTGRILYEKNSEVRLQMASTTKIMTSLLTAESGELDEYFTVDPDAIRVEGSSMGLTEGVKVTRRMLIYGMLLPSGNDAANAAAVSVSGDIESFVELMNKRAAEMGLTSTHFVTPSGLDDYTDEHYSTAKDMALLTAQALKNPDFSAAAATRSICLKYGDGSDCWLKNSNRLLESCEGVIGVKTGFTDKAGRCLVSACRRNGVTLICVTLNDPNDWYDHSRLYDYAFGCYKTVCFEGISVRMPVAGDLYDSETGKSLDFVNVSGGGASISLPAEDAGRVKSTVLLKRFVYMPYAEDFNYPVGYILYTLDDELLESSGIYPDFRAAE